MGKSRNPRPNASQISSKANPSSSTTTTSKSSILKSSFAPSRFQLCLFASVIQGLESQHLRLHDTNNGLLQCDHAIASRASITCLDWGYRSERDPKQEQREAKKKRKRSEGINGTPSIDNTREIALAFGTTDSEIFIFSPAEAKVVGMLKDGHTRGVNDFRFAVEDSHVGGWSIGGDGKLVQWDLRKSQAIR